MDEQKAEHKCGNPDPADRDPGLGVCLTLSDQAARAEVPSEEAEERSERLAEEA